MSPRTRGTLLALCLLLALPAACKRGPREIRSEPGQTWNVYRGDKLVLVTTNAPGPLWSSAMLPPGKSPPQHPFLTAKATSARDEGAISRQLQQATDFDDFLMRLQRAGFRVEPEAK